MPGLEQFTIEQRVLIAFRVLPEGEEFVAILYAGRELTPELFDRGDAHGEMPNL